MKGVKLIHSTWIVKQLLLTLKVCITDTPPVLNPTKWRGTGIKPRTFIHEANILTPSQGQSVMRMVINYEFELKLDKLFLPMIDKSIVD